MELYNICCQSFYDVFLFLLYLTLETSDDDGSTELASIVLWMEEQKSGLLSQIFRLPARRSEDRMGTVEFDGNQPRMMDTLQVCNYSNNKHSSLVSISTN